MDLLLERMEEREKKNLSGIEFPTEDTNERCAGCGTPLWDIAFGPCPSIEGETFCSNKCRWMWGPAKEA